MTGVEGGNPEKKQRVLSKYVQEIDPFYKSTETAADSSNRKFHLTSLYLPKSCANYLFNGHRFTPECGFIKKKDSENHVA